ncbi:MAG: diphosphomevalonate decarboxylase [Candidatus Anstonellaceae archaeon]
MKEVLVVAKAPTNIAIIKYWGKHPTFENYFIPTKSSASFCVDKFFTSTSLLMKKENFSISFELNKKKVLPNSQEFLYILNFFQKVSTFIPEIKNYSYQIQSSNNFPTGAGLASSASGFAALASALAGAFKELEPEVFEKFFSTDEKLSAIARLGSGSASRSVPQQGGFVLWKRGYDNLPKNPKDLDLLFCSYSKSLFSPTHWKELKIIYLILGKEEKKIKSRVGMQHSLSTNPLYYHWVEYEEKTLLPSLLDSIKAKDFEKFAMICMQASNALHSIMLNTYPPIIYLNDKSRKLIEVISELNTNEIIAAYTFDAGPNPIIFTLDKNQKKVLDALKTISSQKNIFVQNIGAGSTFKGML